jgi:hypothetical protein
MTKDALGDADVQKLAATLKKLRDAHNYPVTARELLEVGEVVCDPAKLVTSRKVKGQIQILAKQRQKGADYYANAPVFLQEDAAEVLGGDLALRRIVEFARTKETQACDVKALTVAVPEALKTTFAAAFERRMSGRKPLPVGVGMLRRGGHPVLFLLEDVLKSAPASATVAVTPPPVVTLQAPFPEAFGQAFDELDQETGRRNYVLLHDLRQRLAMIPRPDFDKGLNELRRSQKYSLDSADGRHGRLTPEQVDAGIREAGSVLVYVARR